MAIIYKIKTVEQLVDSAKRYILGLSNPRLTNFNFGSRTRVLITGISVILYQTMQDFITAIKELIPIAIYEGFGFTKKEGVQSTGELKFSRNSPATSDITVPTGTAVTLDGIEYATIEDATILTGNTESDSASAKCSVKGTAGNIDINAIDTINGDGFFSVKPAEVDNAINPIAFSGGTDEESDDQRRSRFNSFVNGLTTSTVRGLRAAALGVEGVVSATVRETFPVAGYNTIYVDDGSGTAPQSILDEVQKVIDGDRTDEENYPGKRAAGIQTVVTTPEVKYISIEMEVRVLQSSFIDDTQLKNDIKSAVVSAINVLPLGYDAVRTMIICVTRGVSSAIFDVILSVPASNSVADDGEVIRYSDSEGTFVITVVPVNP
jgi:uncharacterized phage protein gp47/JayE